MIQRYFRRWFWEPWERIDREAAAERAARPAGFDARVAVTMILCALILVAQEYYGDRPTYYELVGRKLQGTRYFELWGFAWWTAARVLGYLVIPLIAMKAMGLRLADAGLSLRGFRQHAWIYLVLYLAILPVIVVASYTKAFEATYPFYKLAARSWTDFVAWELLYAASFLALELFFRGFLLFAMRRALGSYAIFVMIVPYCMIHFHKPVPEVVGAIFAGVILGTLAMVTRSIWCGVLIHVSVAWTMDWLAMAHVYGLPGSGRLVH